MRLPGVTASFEFEDAMVGLLGGVAGLAVGARAALLFFGALDDESMVMLGVSSNVIAFAAWERVGRLSGEECLASRERRSLVSYTSDRNRKRISPPGEL